MYDDIDMKTYGRYDENLFESNNNAKKTVLRDFDDDNEDIKYSCNFFKGLEVLCSYMSVSDECFENFTEKSMALTMTLFKFIKVIDEFSIALELLIQSLNKIKCIVRV